MISWGESGLRVTADEVEVRLAREPKAQKIVMVRGVVRRPLDYLGEVRAILFTPDSLSIIIGSPAERRRFLDTILSQSNRLIAQTLVRYRHVLGQRNALLRLIALGRADVAELQPWDQQLASLGTAITRARQATTTRLMETLPGFYRSMSGQPSDELGLTYQAGAGDSQEDFLARLEEFRDRELRGQVTLVGPHRDDFIVSLNGHLAGPHASRGEVRSIVLALKWAESQLMTDEDHQPILLLDDLFSELDGLHRDALQQLLSAHQTICTTTDRHNLPTGLGTAATVVEIS